MKSVAFTDEKNKNHKFLCLKDNNQLISRPAWNIYFQKIYIGNVFIISPKVVDTSRIFGIPDEKQKIFSFSVKNNNNNSAGSMWI